MHHFTPFKSFGILILWGIFLTAFNLPHLETIWYQDFQQAQASAQKENKPILMVFSGSDWCKPCILLRKEVFEDEAFKQFAANDLILLNLDFPRRRKNELSPEIKIQHETMAERYNPEGAFPWVLLLDKNGQILGQINHQRNQTQEFIFQIKAILNE